MIKLKIIRMKISENFTLEEFYRSSTADSRGIDNTPLVSEMENIKELVYNVLQPARTALGFPLTITSGYRCSELNRAVGGAANSHHVKGMAADIVCQDNKALYDWILNNKPFCQLIWEKGDDNQPAWVHVSYDKNDLRRQAFRIR